MKLKILTSLLALISAIFILWAVGYIFFVLTTANSKPQDPERVTDAIIVLTGGANRVNEGISLLANKKSQKLFITGVNKDVKKQELLDEWQKTAKASNAKKNKVCCIYLDYQAQNTMENAVEAQKWIKENSILSIRLITSNYHIPRAHLEMKNLLDNIEIIRHPVTSNKTDTSKWRFWSLTFKEYHKTLIVWMRLDHKKHPDQI